MSFPETGYSALVAGPVNWVWKAPPLKSSPEGGFTKITAKIAVFGNLPAWAAPGHKLSASDFGSHPVPVPAGDFYCAGVVNTEAPKHEHDIYDVSWIGFAAGQGRDMDLIHIVFPSVTGGKIITEGFAATVERPEIELPQNGTSPGDPAVIYADGNLVGGAGNVINAETGEYQRTTLLIKRYRRRYSGKAVMTDDFIPEPRCNAPTSGAEAPDPDGNINLGTTAGSGEKRIRRRVWWPEKGGTTGGWPLMTFEANLVDSFGNAMLFEWTAEFHLYREWDW